MTNDAEEPVGQAPLKPGNAIGSYVITRILNASPSRCEYLGRLAPDPFETASSAKEPLFRLVAAPTGAMAEAMAIATLQLRHARLLAIRETFIADDWEYLVIDVPGQAWPTPQPSPLATEEALAVGVMIGEVLALLHTHGVAHQHVRPGNVVMVPEGIFLAGIEDGALIHTERGDGGGHVGGNEPLFARDANFLAQTLGDLAQIAPVMTPASEALARIVRRGADGGYNTIREIMLDALQALPDGLPQLSDEAASSPLQLDIGKATTVGKVRQQNQDAAAILLLEIDDDQPHASPGGIFLVADGMGGEAQGEVASRIAARMITAEVARRFLSPLARSSASDLAHEEEPLGDAPTMMNLDSIAALIEAFRAANARIRNMSRRLERAAGTTATAIMLFGHDGIIGHVGDSRAYLLRGGEMVQLTQDHSLLQRLIELGQYHPETAGANVPRNYLYRSLGQADEVEIDTRIIKLGVGDTIMICSDGLWDLVPDELIRATLTTEQDAATAAQILVDAANSAGGHDNSTALVVRFLQRPVLQRPL